MIYGQWALAFNLLTVAVLAFTIANIFVSFIFWTAKDKLKDYAVSTRKSLLWLFVLAPWLVALLVTLLFSPLFQSGSVFVWLTDLAHWHHPDIFYFFSWHSFSLLIFIGFSCYIVIQKMRVFYQNHHQVNLLRALGTSRTEQVYIIESSIPTAFTGGLLKPSCFVSTGLIEQLSSDDIDIIIQHELAHLYYSDPLKKWFFSFFSAYFTAHVRKLLSAMMSLSMEQDADSFFINKQQQQQSYKVASTLIRFTKLAANYSIHPQYKNELFVHFCRDSLEQRVMHLLNDNQLKPFPLSVVLIAILLLALVSTMSVDSLHHVIETLFTH
ncbi:M56 family metallopeptidase [Colwellia sp. TT2012]|uniref:M56 family metallopeptidase n=1 Tax=Colwellia sp. TT2012 TaxID=1720342 RepID=UPI00070B61C2|nr:M56 family metallopeptidase [Colwellia sp. TT2012]